MSGVPRLAERLGRPTPGAKRTATGQLDEARAGYGRSIAILEELVKSHPNVWYYPFGLASSLRRLGFLEHVAGRFAEAAAANRQATHLGEGLPNLTERDLFELACGRAIQAGLAGKDGSGVPAAAASTEADKAMDLLRQAVAAGHQNLYDLRTDARLDPLRQRDDFQKLRAEREEKAKTHAEAAPAGKVK